jgi:hypothetical protein
MSPRLAFNLIIFVSVFCTVAAASAGKRPKTDEVLARLSYSGTYLVDWRYQQGSPDACFALYRDGSYRFQGSTETGIERVQGRISPEESSRIGIMLRSLSPEEGSIGIVRNSSETFLAEVFRNGAKARYTWINPDNTHPFTDSIKRVVDWLANFKAENAYPL